MTGASGYLGKNIITTCQSNKINVIGCSRNKSDREEHILCDLLNPDEIKKIISLKKPPTVIHCAASVPKDSNSYNNTDFAKDNLTIIENLINAKPKHIVFCSSMTVYDEITVLPAKENDVGSEISEYAKSKLLGEQKIKKSGIPATILRLPGLFGPPRKNGLLYNVVLAFLHGKTPRLAKNSPLWSTLHINDAAETCVRAALTNLVSEYRVINVGYNELMSIPKVVKRIAKMLKVSPPVFPDLIDAPVFKMDLTNLTQLGSFTSNFEQRLYDYIVWVRQEQE